MDNGCSKFTFSNEDLYLQNMLKRKESEGPAISNLEQVKKLNIIGLVTEAGTNQVEIEEGHSIFTFNIYEMKFQLEHDYFQPGLPLYGKLVIYNIQEELRNEVIEICYTIAVKRSWNIQQVNPCTNFTLAADNTISFNILPLKNNVIGLYLTVSFYFISLRIYVQRQLFSKARSLNHTNVKFVGPHKVERLHSSSGSYIKLEEIEEEQNTCRSFQHFDVHFTTDRLRNQENLTFYYMVRIWTIITIKVIFAVEETGIPIFILDKIQKQNTKIAESK